MATASILWRSCLFIFCTAGVLGDENSSYCKRPWPSLSLFLPLNLRTNVLDPRYYEFEIIFLRSFFMFWPLKLSNVALVVGINGEIGDSKPAEEVRATLGGMEHLIPGGLNLTLLPPSTYYRKGYDRQQLVMFWADNFTDNEYVGFIDSDAAFITYVDREDLFENGKPVVNARSGLRSMRDVSTSWAAASFEATGVLEPFKCMSYFPVIVKLSHLKEMRDHIANRYNCTFDEAFLHNISRTAYSQFGVMCTYLYAFKRDEYTWYVHSETPNWDGINPPPVPGQDGNISQFTAQMMRPKPRITTHVGYRNHRHSTNIIVRNDVTFIDSFTLYFADARF